MGFQFPQYINAEDAGDQTVCLTVLNGTLAPGVAGMANLATLIGNGMHRRYCYGSCSGNYSPPVLTLLTSIIHV